MTNSVSSSTLTYPNITENRSPTLNLKSNQTTEKVQFLLNPTCMAGTMVFPNSVLICPENNDSGLPWCELEVWKFDPAPSFLFNLRNISKDHLIPKRRTGVKIESLRKSLFTNSPSSK